MFDMLETIRRYWIGLLVLILVGLHASIVGVIRHQASLAKIDASCEVDLGEFLAYQQANKPPLQMRFHAIVPTNHRMKSRQLIELNQAQIRQSLEEYLRQLDSKVLIDPFLADLKEQLMEVMIQTIGNSSIDDLAITELRQSTNAVSLEFVAKGNQQQPRKMVATLRSKPELEEEAGEEHSPPSEIAPEGDEGDSGEIDSDETPSAKKPVAAKSHADSNSHGSAAKKSSGHGSADKKAAAKPAAGHGADKKKEAKKSGH